MIQTTPPAWEPVTVADVRAWGHIDDAENTALIELAIQQAREEAELITGQRFAPQQLSRPVDASEVINLHGVYPVTAASINGVVQAISSGLPQRLVASQSGTLTVTCGYSSASAVPAGVRMWIILRALTSVEVRQFVSQGQQAELSRRFVDGMLDPYVIPRL